MKLSEKCLSGRERLRVVFHRPSGIDRVMRRRPAHGPVVPRRGTDEVEESLMSGVQAGVAVAEARGGKGLWRSSLRRFMAERGRPDSVLA